METKATLPTMKEITNNYLYGQENLLFEEERLDFNKVVAELLVPHRTIAKISGNWLQACDEALKNSEKIDRTLGEQIKVRSIFSLFS